MLLDIHICNMSRLNMTKTEKFNQISDNKVILKYYRTISEQRRPLYRRQNVNVKEENNRRKKLFLRYAGFFIIVFFIVVN